MGSYFLRIDWSVILEHLHLIYNINEKLIKAICNGNKYFYRCYVLLAGLLVDILRTNMINNLRSKSNVLSKREISMKPSVYIRMR